MVAPGPTPALRPSDHAPAVFFMFGVLKIDLTGNKPPLFCAKSMLYYARDEHLIAEKLHHQDEQAT
jgi:hypothetical protein